MVVGERGPEVVTLPPRATVHPLTADHEITLEIIDNRPIELSVDGEKMAVAVSRHRRVIATAVACEFNSADARK